VRRRAPAAAPGRSLFEGAEEGGGEVADTCSVALVVFQKVHP